VAYRDRMAYLSNRLTEATVTQRGSTCTEFIYSLRLDHAARLLDRRTLLAMSDPISTIAYDCGFRDYTHFARKFRHRFGYPPGAYSAAQARAENDGAAQRGEQTPPGELASGV
jgi:AraC family transcriptional activator of tynA and feaB